MRSYLSSTHKCHSQRVQLGQASKGVVGNAGDGVETEISALCDYMSECEWTNLKQLRSQVTSTHTTRIHSQVVQLGQASKDVGGNAGNGVVAEIAAARMMIPTHVRGRGVRDHKLPGFT